MPQFVTEYLGQAHQELSQMLNGLQEELQVLRLARDLESTSTRLRMSASKITLALHSHIDRQERILYPALEKNRQGLAATLERMRRENDAGEVAEKAFFVCIQQWASSGKNRQEVTKRGRTYVQWVRGYLLRENGRLFPLVERSLDPETQHQVCRAMEELGQETSTAMTGKALSARA